MRRARRRIVQRLAALTIGLWWCAAPPMAQAASDSVFARWLSGADGFEEAMRQHQSSGKAMLVFFYTDWCPYCKRLTKDVLSSEAMQQYVNNVAAVRVNPEAGPREADISQTFHVGGYPSVFVLPAGSNSPRPIDPYRLEGKAWVSLTASEFVEACENAGKKAKAASTSAKSTSGATASSGATVRKPAGASSTKKAASKAVASSANTPRAGEHPVTLYLKNGNVVDGDLVTDGPDAVILRVDNGEVTFQWSEIGRLVKHKAPPTPSASTSPAQPQAP